MIPPCNCILPVLALGFLTLAGIGEAQEASKSGPSMSTAVAPLSDSDCNGPPQLAAGGLGVDNASTGSILDSGELLSGVLVTPEVLSQMHRSVRLVVPGNL